MNRQLSTYILATLISLLLFSCSEEEEFTTSANAKLEFSVDTIQFDTLFNNVTSATERLIVYNRNNKGVRLTNVALKSGGGKGFRINVDGVFGNSISDVEILGKDSIFIFAEVTAPDSSTDMLQHISDQIVFTLENGHTQSVVLDAHGQKARSLYHEVISSDRSLSPELPYIIYDSLVVAKDAKLTIPAGCKLYFHSNASFIVHGSLSIEGELNNEVLIRGDRMDRMFTYLPYDRLDSQWGGIQLTNSCSGCDINHADIHSGNFGIKCDSIQGELTILNSSIHNVGGDGLYVYASKAKVANTQITNALFNCVSLSQANAEFTHCTIVQFYPWAADGGPAVLIVQNEGSTFASDVNFYNCFVTGYSDDELFAEFPEDTELNAHFYSCVLNTDVTDEKYFTNCVAESKDNDRYQDTNFRSINTDDYSYDFRLDSLSVARDKASAEYSQKYPADKNGVTRPMGKCDAGCYQSPL